MLYYAYHPYVVDKDVDITYKILTRDFSIDGCSTPLLWASVTGSNEYDVEFQFTHMLPKVTFNLMAGGVEVTSSELAGAKATLKGAYSTAQFNIGTGEFVEGSKGGETIDITLDVKDGTAVTYQIPQEPANTIELWIKVGDKTFIYPLTSDKWESGNEYKYDITVGEVPPPDIELIEDVYYIYSDKGLAAFRDLVNGYANTSGAVTAGDNFASFSDSNNKDIDGKLTKNIDLSEICGADATKGNWSPIKNYTGSFEGGGFEVSSLYIDSESKDQGLFGVIKGGAAISNLGVSGSVVGKEYVGGVVGYANGSSGSVSITNCYSDCSVSVSPNDAIDDYYFGGVVGYANYTNVTSCYNTGVVTASSRNNVGGVVGCSDNSTLSNCYNTGGVKGKSYVGGVVGCNNLSSTVEKCYSTGNVSGAAQVGGVVGYNTNTSTISNGYNMGEVKGSSSVGGVVGWNTNNSTVENCYSAGSVRGKLYYIGGVVGQNACTVSYCFYDTSTVSGTDTSYTYTATKAIGSDTTNNGTDDDNTNYYFGLDNTAMKGDASTSGNLLYYLTNSDYGKSTEWQADTDTPINKGYPILKWQVKKD